MLFSIRAPGREVAAGSTEGERTLPDQLHTAEAEYGRVRGAAAEIRGVQGTAFLARAQCT